MRAMEIIEELKNIKKNPQINVEKKQNSFGVLFFFLAFNSAGFFQIFAIIITLSL